MTMRCTSVCAASASQVLPINPAVDLVGLREEADPVGSNRICGVAPDPPGLARERGQQALGALLRGQERAEAAQQLRRRAPAYAHSARRCWWAPGSLQNRPRGPSAAPAYQVGTPSRLPIT